MQVLSERGVQALKDYIADPNKIKFINEIQDGDISYINRFVSNSDFKSFFHQLLTSDLQFHGFCQKLDAHVVHLDTKNWDVSCFHDKHKHIHWMKFDTFIKGIDIEYSVGIRFIKIKELHNNVLASFYIMVGHFPLFKRYVNLVKEQVLEHCTVSDHNIRKIVLQAYKQLSRQHLVENNSRLRAMVYEIVCSNAFKDRVSALRRDFIRPTMTRGLRDLMRQGTLEDIEYFISEIKIEDVMNS